MNLRNKITGTALLLTLCCATPLAAQEKNEEVKVKKWDLETCINYAIEHNITIQQQQIEVKQKELDKHTAKWSRLPAVNASASEGINWGRSASPVDNTYRDTENSNLSLGLGANLPLFTGLRIPNQYALSKINLAASLEDLKKAKEDLSVQIAQQYLQVLYNKEIRETNKLQVELSKQQLERLEKQFEIGKIAENQVVEARAQVAQDEATLVESENTYHLSLLSIAQLLELPSPENFSLIDPIHQDVNKNISLTFPMVYQNALIKKPGIQAAQLRLKGSKNSIRIAQSAYMPSLNLSGSVNTGYYHVKNANNETFSNQLDHNLNKSINLSLSIPIFNRFETRNNVRQAKLQRDLLKLQLENERKQLYKEVQQAYYNALAAQIKYKSAQKSVEAQKEAFRTMTTKYECGQSTILEFKESKLAYVKALSQQLQAKYEFIFRDKILHFYNGEAIK